MTDKTRMTDCQHLDLHKCLVGNVVFYKCTVCKRNFKCEPLTIKVSYPDPIKTNAISGDSSRRGVR